MTQLVRGRNDTSLRHGSHDDMRSGTHSPLWNPRGVLDIRPGAGNAKNGEGERLGAAIQTTCVLPVSMIGCSSPAESKNVSVQRISVFSMIQCYAPRPQV